MNTPIEKKEKSQIYEKLEKDVVLLNTLFCELHHIIKEQNQQLDTLEDSISRSTSDVSIAHKDIIISNNTTHRSVKNIIIGTGLASIVYLYNPYLAIGTVLAGLIYSYK